MPITHRSTRARALAALALATSTAIAGCGSDETDPAPVPPATSAASATGAPAQQPAPAGDVTVAVDDMAFSPAAVTVRVGDTVTWEFSDSVPHSVQGIGDKAMGINSPILTTGEWSFTFTQPGEYRYLCSLHPQMRGSVTVE